MVYPLVPPSLSMVLSIFWQGSGARRPELTPWKVEFSRADLTPSLSFDTVVDEWLTGRQQPLGRDNS